MLFILFDIEIVFLYPLAVILHRLAWFGFVEFLFFIVILALAYVYIWRKGRSSGSRARRSGSPTTACTASASCGSARGRASSRRSSATSRAGSGITTLAKAVRWAQTKSMWPDTFGLACCAIEMMSIVSARYDIARFGMEAFRASPRQADLLIVSGRVAHKMAAPLRQIYDQMLEPKWVIAMGACASSGGMFNNYTTLQGVDKIVAVDIYVPGCPPRPEAADGRDPAPARGRAGRRAARATRCGASRRDVDHVPELTGDGLPRQGRGPGARLDERGVRRDDGRRRARRARRGVQYLRDEQGFNFLSDISADRLPRLGRAPACPATSARRAAAT